MRNFTSNLRDFYSTLVERASRLRFAIGAIPKRFRIAGLLFLGELAAELANLAFPISLRLSRAAVIGILLLGLLSVRFARRTRNSPRSEAPSHDALSTPAGSGDSSDSRASLVRIENQLLTEIHRAKSRAAAVNVLVRRLSMDLQNGFVAFLGPQPSGPPAVQNSRRLSEESSRSMTLDDELQRQLELQDFVHLKARALRSHNVYKSLSASDRKLLPDSLKFIRLGTSNSTLGWLVTSTLFRVRETDVEQLDMFEFLGRIISQRWPLESPPASAQNTETPKAPVVSGANSLIDRLHAVLTEARTRFPIERASAWFFNAQGELASSPAAKTGSSGPPGVEAVWHRHERTIALRALVGGEARFLRTTDLESMGIRTLIRHAVVCRLALQNQTIGVVCLTISGKPNDSAEWERIANSVSGNLNVLLQSVVDKSRQTTQSSKGRRDFASENVSHPTKGCTTPDAMNVLFGSSSPSMRDSSEDVERPRPAADFRSEVPPSSQLKSPKPDEQGPASEFLASVTHELRAPMVGILGMTDLVLESELTEKQREYLSAVRSSSNTLLQLVNDLLDQSKLQAGQFEFESIPFRLRETIQQMLLSFRPEAQAKGIVLELKIPDCISETRIGDPLRLRQCLTNLVGNAFKFTSRGSVCIAVDELAEDRLQFAVSDTGCGIPLDQQAKLFARYVQAESSTARQFGGTGLGLNITRQLVEGMGGEISLNSQVGVGTTLTFAIRLPGCGPNESHIHGSEESSAEAHAQSSRGPSLRVLLVEDHEINIAVGVQRLEQQGHRVTVARDGREAIRLAAENAYDLILMDLQIPELNGIEATRRIRDHESARGERTPIFAMTSTVTEGDEERCLAAGFDGFLTKPIDVPKVESLLRSLPSWTPPSERRTSPDPILAEPLNDFARELLPLFLESAQGNLTTIETGLEALDWKRVSQAGHALCGAASSMGLKSLSEQAFQLEQSSRKERLAETRNQYRNLCESLSALRESSSHKSSTESREETSPVPVPSPKRCKSSEPMLLLAASQDFPTS